MHSLRIYIEIDAKKAEKMYAYTLFYLYNKRGKSSIFL